MASHLAKVLISQQARLKKEYDSKAGTRFVKEVEQSMLFQYNWADLLSAAPTALSLLGACHFVSSSNEAAAITLGSAMPKGGWKYLKVAEKPTLKACLVYVGDVGAKAFSAASTNMELIANTAGELTETATQFTNYCTQVSNVIQATRGLPESGYERNLDNSLKQLQALSKNCVKYAGNTEKAFDDWLLCITEFHTASVQKHGTTEAEAQANTSSRVQAVIEASYQEENLKSADKVVDKMLQFLGTAEGAFKKANDDVPSAWESCAINAIDSIVQAIPTVLAQAIPFMAGGVNGVTLASSALITVGQTAPDVAKIALGGNTPTTSPTGAGTKPATTAGTPSNSALGDAMKNMTPPEPAYIAAPLIAPFLNSLHTYLTAGPNNGVDWAKFKKDTNGKGKEADGLTWLLTNLEQQEKGAMLGDSEPSKSLKEALRKTISTIKSIQTEVLKSSDIASQATSTKLIETWQKNIKQAKVTVLQLETTAKSFPGTSVNTPQIFKSDFNIPATDHTSQVAALNAATEKLAINQRAVNVAQQNYMKACESALKVRQELTEIQTKLDGLKMEGITLEKVKGILVDCIATLVQLKVQISNIKNFFSALSAMVQHVVQNKVGKHLRDVSSLTTNTNNNQIPPLTNMDIEIIYSSTLQIKAYFGLLQTIASMYRDMHVKYMAQGINLVHELSKVALDPKGVTDKHKELTAWAKGAIDAIVETISSKENEIKKSLNERIKNIADQTEMLEKMGVPIPAKHDPAITNALKTGACTLTDPLKKSGLQGLGFQRTVDLSC
ncbi:hypothetical protein FQN57_005841 [Myotisia sp. PD_48]|nr:hypothetical protein FQN57_005841 [Myotisia sp. PD_48]